MNYCIVLQNQLDFRFIEFIDRKEDYEKTYNWNCWKRECF